MSCVLSRGIGMLSFGAPVMCRPIIGVESTQLRPSSPSLRVTYVMGKGEG
jgi:hypothetical protein